jgi:hypothetical protein
VQKEALPPGIVRAALAFSALSTYQADSISGRLRPRDRARLRAGLVHVRGARDCPFRCVETHTATEVASVLEKVARRRPLHVAVALSHMEPHIRDAIWEELPLTTRGDIVDNIQDVPTVSPGRTRAYARELLATLEPE